VVTQYQVASGATVYAEGSWLLTSGFNMSYTVMFERATLDFDSARGADALRLDEEGQPSRTVKPEGVDGYVEELRHLLASIQSGKAPTIVTPQDGLSAVEICEAEERSVQTGRVVEF
jgi:predicted dehydrogenase